MTSSTPLPRRLILRTGNLMSSGIGRNYATFAYNSSAELLAGLKEEFTNAKQLSPSSWTKFDSTGTVFAPGTLASGHIKEERASYDITVKLFYLPSVPPAARAEHTEEAVRLVLEELGTGRIDLLNVSFPGVYFDANDEIPDEGTDDNNQNTEERAASDPDQAEEDDEETKSFLHTYRVLEKLVHEGKVGKIGLSEFGTGRLRRLLRGLEREAKSPGFPTTERIKPKVVQINVRDCCVVPRELILYARKEGIQLYTHNDCAEILTREGIEGVVEEGGIWNPWNQDKDVEMSGVGADENAPSPGKRKRDEHSRWGLFPQWVIKYHAVVSDRSIIENKGYIATAEVR